jgi:uncharacterized repeat protein (TIGR02543 family)
MASNANTIADEDGDFEDWIELLNYGEAAINLTGYGLSDNSGTPFKWVFPNISIQPGGYIMIWASGKNRINTAMPLHTNFSISADGEEILLTSPTGVLVDELRPVRIPVRYTYGKYPNGTGEWRYFTTPTPRAQNIGPGYAFLVSPPQFSRADGMYTEGFALELSTNQDGAIIYYTLDGSEPSQSSTLYQGPISITSRVGVPNDISMIPTNNDNNPGPPYYEGWQAPLGEVYKINVVRARAYHPQAPLSEVLTYTYLIDPTGSNRYTLPFLSLTTHRNNLFSNETGIYVAGNNTNYFQDGDEWERPANVIFIENGSKLGFKEDVGIRLHGNTTRSRPRKSIRISARSEYGNSWIDYKLFPDKEINTYKRMILRNSGNDWDWSVFRDAFAQYLAKDLKVETQYYRPSVLFINGEYWGIHNIRDRYDEHYIQSHYGIAEDQMTIMENNSLYKFGNPTGVDHYTGMLSFINSNSLSGDANYNYVKTLIDVESFIDFQLTNIFAMNTDWPGNNSLYWRYLRDGYDPNAPKGMDGRWRWMILDTDFGFGLPFNYVPGFEQGPAHNTLSFAMEANGPNWPNPSWSTLLLRKLLANQQFKYQFINRYCDLLNTTFSSLHTVAVIDSISQLLEPEMQEHINRWRRPTSSTEWKTNVDVMRTFAKQRPAYQRLHVKQKFALTGEANINLNVSNEKYGRIKVNTIDIWKKTMGVSTHPYPRNGTYFKGVPIQLEAIPEPGYQFSNWSGASTSTEPKITITLTADSELTAHFSKAEDPQLMHFWFFGSNILNDTPLESVEPTYKLINGSTIEFQSALEGYPFQSTHPSWRKASMERRNSPTSLNYIPMGNSNIPYASSNIRGLQIKQPFTGDGGENTLIFHTPTTGFENIVFRFAAINEGAAEGLAIAYSTSTGEPNWTSQGLANSNLSLSSIYQLFEVDFSGIVGVANNPNLKIRIKFYGSNMTVDLGNRVTFNNFSVSGVSLTAYSITATAGSNGKISPSGNVGVYKGGNQSFVITPDAGYKITNVTVNGQSALNDVTVNDDGIGIYNFTSVQSNSSIIATFGSATDASVLRNEIAISIYPNPSKGIFIVSAPSTIQRIDVVNMTGRIVYTSSVQSLEHIVNSENVPTGIYFVRVFTSEGVVTGKVIVN